jgi:hypothetical protein
MNYVKQIDRVLKQYEEHRAYKVHSIDWICDRISWCWKWRKISEWDKDDFCERIIFIMEEYK